MTERPVLTPTDDYPITITPTGARVTVRAGGQLIADSTAALTLREANLPPVQYLPPDDVVADRLVASATESYCPFKGDAAYLSLADGSVADVAWCYPRPHPAMTAIAGYLAFYPDRAEITLGG